MILEDGREIRVSDRIEVWDARRCVRVLRPAAGEEVRVPDDLAFADGAFVSLAGLAVLVVGGTRGIGRALASACRVRGAEVIASGRSDCDVRDEGAVRAFVSRHERIDVVVQCAALPGGDFADVQATNVTGAFHVARALLDRGAPCRFIGVSSGVTDTPVAGAPAYVASKHGLEGLVRALAREESAMTFTAVQLGACASPSHALPALLHAIVAPVGDFDCELASATNGILLFALLEMLIFVKSTPVLLYWFDIQTYGVRPAKMPMPPRTCDFESFIGVQLKPTRGENCCVSGTTSVA